MPLFLGNVVGVRRNAFPCWFLSHGANVWMSFGERCSLSFTSYAWIWTTLVYTNEVDARQCIDTWNYQFSTIKLSMWIHSHCMRMGVLFIICFSCANDTFNVLYLLQSMPLSLTWLGIDSVEDCHTMHTTMFFKLISCYQLIHFLLNYYGILCVHWCKQFSAFSWTFQSIKYYVKTFFADIIATICFGPSYEIPLDAIVLRGKIDSWN